MRPKRKPELALVTEAGRSLQSLDVEGGGRQRSDEELVIAAQSGDAFAMDELLGRHQGMMHGFACRFGADADEAADLVQESMLRAFRNIGKFRSESRFATWLVAIVINTAISRKRKEKHFHWVYLDEPKTSGAQTWQRSLQDLRLNPEERYLHCELRALLRREIRKLHPKYRFILQACDLDECPVEQAAQSLGMSYATAKSRLRRARQSLSAALQRRTAVHSELHAG